VVAQYEVPGKVIEKALVDEIFDKIMTYQFLQ